MPPGLLQFWSWASDTAITLIGYARDTYQGVWAAGTSLIDSLLQGLMTWVLDPAGWVSGCNNIGSALCAALWGWLPSSAQTAIAGTMTALQGNTFLTALWHFFYWLADQVINMGVVMSTFSFYMGWIIMCLILWTCKTLYDLFPTRG